MAVSLFVEYQSDGHATVIDIFPLTSEEMSITGQWCARRSRSVVKNSSMATSRYEHHANEEHRRDIEIS
jgi:hypothetical protein